MTEPHFAELERRFLRLVSQPRPIAEVAEGPLCQWIDAPNEQVAAARLGIYSHMYFARLRDSLREDFSAFASLVEPAVFDRLAAKYLERWPSRDASLRYHGQHFSEFLARGLAEREAEFLALRPDAAALCALEWARIEAFDAQCAPLLTRDELSRLEPEAWADLRLQTVPSARLLSLDFAVNELWCAIEAQASLSAPRSTGQRLLVFRREFRVYQREVSDAEAEALAGSIRGATFSELCECFAEGGVSLEACAERAFAALSQWLADELLVLPEPSSLTRTS